MSKQQTDTEGVAWGCLQFSWWVAFAAASLWWFWPLTLSLWCYHFGLGCGGPVVW